MGLQFKWGYRELRWCNRLTPKQGEDGGVTGLMDMANAIERGKENVNHV
jgi:hypothetical protein